MAYSKIILNGDTLMDVTGDTVDAGKLLYGETATKNSGAKVTGNIASKSSSDLTASGATVTAPAGYYSSSASKSVASGSATPASSISATGATVSTGTNTLTLSKTVSNTPSVSAGYISSGTSGNSSVSLTASVNTRSSSDLTASGATVTAPAGYYSSGASKAVDSITLPTSASSTGTGTLKATISSSTSTQYINIPTGYNSANACYQLSAMPSGSAGTPTATKGTVSNHSITVTPSVTNTTGYITGSTKTGTAVTVSASELVSGTKSITDNGTGIDVTNYASVDVEVSSASTTHTATIIRSGVRDTRYPLYNYVQYNSTYYYTKGNTFTFNSGDTMTVRQLGQSTQMQKLVMENGIVIATSSNNDYTYTYTMPDYDIEITLEQTYGATSGTTSSVNISKVNDFCKLIASTTYKVNTTSSTGIDVGTFQTGDTSLWTSDKMVFIKIRDKVGRRNGYYYGSDAIICNNIPGNSLSSTSSILIYGTSYYQDSSGNLINYNLQRTSDNNAVSGYGIYPTRIYDNGDIDIQAKCLYSPEMGTINSYFYVDVFLSDWFGGVSPFYG